MMERFPTGSSGTNRDDLLWLMSHGGDLAHMRELEREWKACGCGDEICCSKCLYRNEPETYIPASWMAW